MICIQYPSHFRCLVKKQKQLQFVFPWTACKDLLLLQPQRFDHIDYGPLHPACKMCNYWANSLAILSPFFSGFDSHVLFLHMHTKHHLNRYACKIPASEFRLPYTSRQEKEKEHTWNQVRCPTEIFGLLSCQNFKCNITPQEIMSSNVSLRTKHS